MRIKYFQYHDQYQESMSINIMISIILIMILVFQAATWTIFNIIENDFFNRRIDFFQYRILRVSCLSTMSTLPSRSSQRSSRQANCHGLFPVRPRCPLPSRSIPTELSSSFKSYFAQFPARPKYPEGHFGHKTTPGADRGF